MIKTVMRQVDRDAAKYNIELDDLRATVQALTREGLSASHIAEVVGVCDRQVQRIRVGNHAATKQPMTYRYDLSEERQEHLEQVVDSVVALAARMRDEDPGLVFEVLSRLHQTQLIELCQVALAGIPMDRTKTELWGWL